MAPDSRTGPGTTPSLFLSLTASKADTSLTPSPMRRRRDASRRLPVLAGGYHDPLDGERRAPRRPGRCARAILGANGVWRPCCRGDHG
jgi:hypothetical protein